MIESKEINGVADFVKTLTGSFVLTQQFKSSLRS